MIYVHSCDFCQGSRAKRAIQRVLFRLPNITDTKAARLADVERPYVCELRPLLEAHGCVPKRTTSGTAQGHVERHYEAARTSGGAPIARTPAFDFDAVVRHFDLLTVVTQAPRSAAAAPIGVVCYPGMTRAA